MLLLCQYSIADSRRFLQFETGELTLPKWPIPSENEFVRSYGPIRRRRRGGERGLIGENFLCESKRAFVFPKMPLDIPIGSKGKQLSFNLKFRRFYFDGFALGKYEIGFVNNKLRSRQSVEVDPSILLRTLLGLRLTINVSGSSNTQYLTKQETNLNNLVRFLPKQYHSISSHHEYSKELATNPWIIQSGVPLLYIQTFGNKKVNDFSNSQTISEFDSQGINIQHSWQRIDDQIWRIWHVHLSIGYNKSKARQARLHLLRIHSELSVLKSILAHIRNNRMILDDNSIASRNLRDYLYKSTRYLNCEVRKKNSAISESIIHNFAEIENLVNPGESALLLDILETKIGVRNQTLKVMEKVLDTYSASTGNSLTMNFIGEEMTIRSGNQSPITIASGDIHQNITSAFNTGSSVDADSDLAQRLSKLENALVRMLESLENQDVGDLERDVTDFVSEAKSDSPRKHILEATAESISNVASGVTKYGKPVIEALKWVIALLV